MIWSTIADALVVVHFAFSAFVIFGGFLTWRWPRLALAHLPALAWGCWIEVSHVESLPTRLTQDIADWKPQILHFFCHGVADETLVAEGEEILEAPATTGQDDHVDVRELAERTDRRHDADYGDHDRKHFVQ